MKNYEDTSKDYLKNKQEDRRSNINLNVVPGLPRINEGATKIEIYRTLDARDDNSNTNRLNQGSQLTSHSHLGLKNKAAIKTSTSVKSYVIKNPDYAPLAPGKLEFNEQELVNYYLNVQ